MKICILTHTFPRFPKDVAAPFMYGVAKALVDNGNEVYVLTPYSDKFGWKKEKLPFKLITYKYALINSWHKLGYSETLTNDMGLPIVMWLLSPFMYFAGMIALFKLVKQERIEIINAHWVLPNGFIASAVALLTGTPVVSTLPGSDVYMVRKNALFNLLGRFATWKSSWITSNSEQLLLDLQKLTGINLAKKSSVIIYGVDPNKFHPTKEKITAIKRTLGISKYDIVVLGVGRLVAKKGFLHLVEAAKHISKKFARVKYVIIGDGDQRQELESKTNDLGLSEKIIYPGWVNYADLIHYYNLADIFVLPSVRDEEGNLDDQSVSVVEAMACGKPVVTTDFPGYRYVVKDGSGFLVQEKDSQDLARKILYLLQNSRLRNRMGKNARNDVLANFSWRAVGNEYTKLFSTLNKKYYSVGVPKITDSQERLKKAKQIMGVLKVHVGNTKNLKCLDVGSSTGEITSYLARNFKIVYGVDVDQNAIVKAKEKFSQKNLKFVQAKDEKLDFKNSSFDIVVCNQVYNFVDNPQKLLDEIYRVLKPGGMCFFGARNRWALMEPQYNLPFGSWFPKLLPHGKNYLGYYQLRKLVKKFEVKDYTIEILRQPEKYGYASLGKYSMVARLLPLEVLKTLIPNYIFALTKKG